MNTAEKIGQEIDKKHKRTALWSIGAATIALASGTAIGAGSDDKSLAILYIPPLAAGWYIGLRRYNDRVYAENITHQAMATSKVIDPEEHPYQKIDNKKIEGTYFAQFMSSLLSGYTFSQTLYGHFTPENPIGGYTVSVALAGAAAFASVLDLREKTSEPYTVKLDQLATASASKHCDPSK